MNAKRSTPTPAETLQTLIDEVTQIQDPFERFARIPDIIAELNRTVSTLSDLRSVAAREFLANVSLREASEHLREHHGMRIAAQGIHRVAQDPEKRRAQRRSERSYKPKVTTKD